MWNRVRTDSRFAALLRIQPKLALLVRDLYNSIKAPYLLESEFVVRGHWTNGRRSLCDVERSYQQASGQRFLYKSYPAPHDNYCGGIRIEAQVDLSSNSVFFVAMQNKRSFLLDLKVPQRNSPLRNRYPG